MSKFIGRRLSVGIGKEVARGTGVAASYWLNATSFSFYDKVTKINTEGRTGGIWGGDNSYVAQKWADGDIEAELTDKSFGLILLAALGTVSSAVFSGAYKHTFSLQNDNQHDSLSIHTTNPIDDLIFELSMIDSLNIEITPDAIVTYTVAFRAKNSAGSSTTAAYVAENKFLGRHTSVKIADATGDLTAASTLSCIKRLSLTINKNIEGTYCLGTVQQTDIINKMFSITGEIELDYESNTIKEYMLDGDTKALRIDLVNSGVTIGTTNPSFRIDLSKVEFEGWEPDFAIDDIVTQTITFNALYDNTNENLINDCYLINEVDAY